MLASLGLSIVAINLILYGLFLVNISKVTAGVGIVLGLALGWLGSKKIKFSWPKWYLWPLILGSGLMVGWVLSPLVAQPKLGTTNYVSFPGIGDYNKHVYVVTAIANSQQLPPIHPYFPVATLSYYYGYYLLPAALTIFWPTGQLVIIYGYVLLTAAMSLIILAGLIQKYVKTAWGQVGALGLIVGGTGLDIIPTLLYPISFNSHHIELWTVLNGIGWAVNNTYTAFLWVPQHFWAAAVGLVAVEVVLTSQQKWWPMLILAFLGLSSVFVAAGVGIIGVMAVIFYPPKRSQIVKIGVGVAILLLPYLRNILKIGGGAFEWYWPKPLAFTGWGVANYLIQAVVEGGVLPGVVIYLLWREKQRMWVGVMIVSGIVASFIRSSGWVNDMGVRLLLIFQLGAAIWVMRKVVCRPKKEQIILSGLLAINLVVSATGYLYEYYYRWKERKIFDAYQSELMLKLRQWPKEVSIQTMTTEDWTFEVPILGFRPQLGIELLDSGVYLRGEMGQPHAVYEQLGKGLAIGKTPSKNEISKLKKFLLMYRAEVWLLDKRTDRWYKWLVKNGIKEIPVTAVFTTFKTDEVIKFLEGEK